MSENVLFITLDSCRFDTLANGSAPNIKAVAPLHKAQAPSYFTYGSHSAMFVGFTPGIPGAAQPLLDPKFGKLFKLVGAGFAGKGTEGYELQGRNIVEGFRNLGYVTIGTAAMGWFDPRTATGRHLSESFEHFFYAGPYYLRSQIDWLEKEMTSQAGKPTFTFINVGETHVPYWHEGAAWSPEDNPCQPFQTQDRSPDCRTRQTDCLKFADQLLASIIEQHLEHTIIICGDHGDCWGEDGLWEHGIMHEMTTTVPLLIRFKGKPVVASSQRPPNPATGRERWNGVKKMMRQSLMRGRT